MQFEHAHYDVIVIGAGPAGSATATFLAQQGRRVLLLEKATFPRYHIGESLMTETYWPLARLGMVEKLRDKAYVRKHSVQFYNQDGKGSKPFYFSDYLDHECAVTWQVPRDEFDEMLMENAREQGVEAHDEVAVDDVLFEGDRAVGVMARPAGGEPVQLHSRVVVDGSGMTALLSKKLGLFTRDPKLRKAAVFTCFKGGRRDAGADEGATLIISTPEQKGWFWYIPLADDIVSVGVVSDARTLFDGREKDYDRVMREEIAGCEPIRSRLENAERCMDYHACSDLSYKASRIAGDGWVLVGDAFGFLDPVYSSGVFLALKSAELAADTIHEALREDDVSGVRLSRFGDKVLAGMESMRKLVYAFYEKDFSFGGFVREHPEYRTNLVDLLMGNVYREGVNDMFTAMQDHIEVPREARFARDEKGAVLVP